MTLAEFWPLCLLPPSRNVACRAVCAMIAPADRERRKNGVWVVYGKNQFAAIFSKSQFAKIDAVRAELRLSRLLRV